jgi:hypothetical protein
VFSVFESVYTACLRAADWVIAHRVMAAAAGCAAVAAAAILINQAVLLEFPNSGDEYAYLYQAATMAEGRLWNAAPRYPEFFELNYIVQDGGRAFGSFPVGWPLLLTAALELGLPAWVVNPILGAVSLLLIACLGTRLYSARVGVIAAALTAITPFFLFNAGSFFSHTFCGTLLLGAACLAARENRSPSWVPMAIGFLIGWAVLARYFTGVIIGVPIVLFLLRPDPPSTGWPPRVAGRTLALVAAGGAPWVLVLMAYNEAMTGNPWRLTTLPTTVSLWFRDGFLLRGADILSTHLERWALWTPPLAVLLYLVFLRRAPHLRRGALSWLPVIVAGAFYFYIERGGNQYGPRFHYEALPFLVIFVTASLFDASGWHALERPERWAFAALAASVAVLPFLFVFHAVREHKVIRERTDPYSTVAEARLQNALVLIGGRIGTERSMDAKDLTRNDLSHMASVLYALDISPERNCFLSSQYPGRSAYLYVWDRERDDGVLSPLVCGR